MSHILAPLIFELFNTSIDEGIFPSCLKTGCVIPIFKSSKKYQMMCYRPITTLPVLTKFFEKIAHKKMMYFINRLNLLSTHQFGL